MSALGRGQLARFAGIFAGGTLISRVLGLARDVILGALIPTAGRDAFFLAFQLPNLLRDMLGEGAANAALVPVLAQRRETDGDAAFAQSIRVLLGVFALLLMLVTLTGVLLIPFVPDLVQCLGRWSGGDPKSAEQWHATVELMQWTFPYLFFIGLSAFATAPLFILRHYSTPSWAPALLNVALIGCCWFLRDNFASPTWALVAGVWIGGMAQTGVMLLALWREGFPVWPSFRFRHPDIAAALLLMGPVVIGQAAGEVNKFIDKFFAYSLETGVVTSLYFANRLIQLPLALFGIAISAAVLPSLAAAVTRGDDEDARATLAFGLRLCFLLTAPAVAGLLLLGEPIVRLLFQYGYYDAGTTAMTNAALFYYAFGLIAFTWIKVAAQGFYARHDTRTPVIIAAACMLLNIGLNFALVRPMGFEGLALATTIAFTLNAVLLIGLLARRHGNPFDPGSLAEFAKVLLASAVASAAAYGVHEAIAPQVGTETLLTRAVAVLPAIATAAALYAAACYFLQIRDIRSLANTLRRRAS